MTKQVQQFLAQHFPKIVEWRRYLHQYPEISFQEKQTALWIEQQLQQIGCEVERNEEGYGLVVTIHAERPGPFIALRADIDALPIQDEKEDCHYRSQIAQVMHACGHDGHTAALLAIASYYKQHNDWSGSRRLIFQPAEEVSPGGALGMIKAGALQDVDVIYGAHLWTPLPYGQAATTGGPFMSSADEFAIEIIGKGGHGGLPHEAIDSIIVATDFVQAIQKIISRNINPLAPAVISIGSIKAGSAANVIAERCYLNGTIRAFDEQNRLYLMKRIEEVLQHICALHGATYELKIKQGYPSLINDKREAARFFSVAEQLLGSTHTVRAEPITVSEDFSYYLQEVPGCFMFVGAGNDEIGANYPHHHPKFNIDERAIINAAALLITLAEDYSINHS
ncbi:M20 metallopeptidase family protein [Paenibacillus yanchengensis]|uniref:M20 family metallopeptidase n=1 Tax=Paenibacillus yanchengensis TaxID=2035833 RepID=A0ABW4YMG2_9BACL